MEIIKIDINPKGITPVCHASQYDVGREIGFYLMDGLQARMLTDETVEIHECKSDTNIVTAEASYTTGTNLIIVTTTEQMTAAAGDCKCEMRIIKDNVNVGTINFILKVEEDPLKNGIESDTEIYNLSAQIEALDIVLLPPLVAAEVAEQYDSNNVFFDTAPTEGHGVGYVVCSENVPDEIIDLNDVVITTPTEGEALVWNGNEWVNGTVSTVGSIDDLNDVDTTGKVENDSLRYDATAQEWQAKPTTVIVTQAEYNQLKLADELLTGTNYIITDAPSLDYTADDISYDGTATTIRDAIIGEVQTLTLAAANWSSNTITVNVTGVTATSNQEIFGLEATSAANILNNKNLQAANIMGAGQAAGTITLYAENPPSSDVQIRVIVRG